MRLFWLEIRSVRGQAAAATAVSLASVGATLACPLLVRVFINRANGGTLLDALAASIAWNSLTGRGTCNGSLAAPQKRT
jgi:hypothetical protein